MKTLENIEHVQTEIFILIIGILHSLWENEIIVYMNICSTHLKLKEIKLKHM